MIPPGRQVLSAEIRVDKEAIFGTAGKKVLLGRSYQPLIDCFFRSEEVDDPSTQPPPSKKIVGPDS